MSPFVSPKLSMDFSKDTSGLRSSLKSFRGRFVTLALTSGLALLAGCAVGPLDKVADPVQVGINPVTTGVTGRVHGGQQPVSGSTVQLWQVGTTGYGSGAAPLGTPALTDAGGNFSITGNYSCANGANGGSTLVYITATGGNPGLPGNVNNSAMTMMAALGACGNLTSSTYLTINEVTTVASVYALAQFMSPSGGIGSYATSTTGLTNAFATVNNLANIGSGSAQTVTPSGTGIAPQARINTVADILAPCINSSGPGSNPCTALFSAATPPSGAAPTTAIAASLNIALYPGNNVSALLNMASGIAPFQPIVSSANDWTMSIAYASGGVKPAAVAVDSTGGVWVGNYGSGGTTSSVSRVSPLGVSATNSPFTSTTSLNGITALAIDQNNNAWVANHDNNSASELTSATAGTSTTISAAAGPFSGSGISLPTGIALDGSANVWLVNNGNNSVTTLNHTNYAAAGTNYASIGLAAPQSLAFDSLGDAWVSNTSGSSVAKLNPNLVTLGTTLYTGAGLSVPSGVAIDRSGNVWVTDASAAQLAELSSTGSALSPATGNTGGGLTAATGDAIDGSGNVWVASKAGNRLTEFSPLGVAKTPSTGYQDSSFSAPVAVAIDGSGNLWVANGTPVTQNGQARTLTEVVGVAAPAVVPISLAVRTAQLGAKPGTPQPVAAITTPITGTAGTDVQFSGSSSTDPGSLALTYSWTFGDGSGGSGATPTHTYSAAGSYPVTLTVTNSDGSSNIARAIATIAAAPVQPPTVVTGGPYTGSAGLSVSFNGTGSSDPVNPGGGPYALTFVWNFGDGTQGFGSTPVHTYSQAGTYTVTLTAQTASGGMATASTTATIAASSSLAGVPTVSAGGPYTGTTSAAVTFTGTGTDPNNAALTYHWDFGDGNSNDGNPITHTYPVAGTYSVSLYVFNGVSGNSASTIVTITGPTTGKLVANAGGPYTVAVNQAITVDGSKTTNPARRQLVYSWDFGDGGSRSGVQPTYIYTKSGTYTLTLNVTDGAGKSDTAKTQVTVTGPPAEAVRASAGGPYADVSGHAIIFDASASTDNLNNSLTYTWTFGDGATGTGVTPTHAYAAKGTYTATVTATSGTATGTATATVVITQALTVAITSPTANQLFGTNTITVTGTVPSAGLTVNVNGVAATVSGTSFTAAGVTLREGVNLISASATDGNGSVGTGTVSVILDATAPTVSITSPVNGATVSSPSITVAGLVNDIVTGTIGSNNVTVKVNGIVAGVLNRSYSLSNVQLVPGSNTITVVATDNVSHSSQATATVQYVVPSSQLSLAVFNGDGQTAAIDSVLPQPLIVQLRAADGTPVPNRPVTFTVTRSNGLVKVMPDSSQSLFVTTDATGKASVLFQVGSRSGLGINQVTATTPGASAAVMFTESTTPGPPTQIHAVRGENQRGLLGQSLPEAFQVIVADVRGNPITGVPVTFTVTTGDGTVDRANTTTDSNGKAISSLTLGQQEGISNYAVNATFAGNAGTPVVFAASGYAPGPIANTSVSGVVLDNANTPIANATVRLMGTALATVSDTNGRFLLSGAPVGTVTLSVDGSTSTRTETFPFLSFVLQSLPGQNNTLNKPIYLPFINVNDAQTVGGDDPVTLTMAGVPGVAFTVAPHSVTFPDGSTVGKMSLSQVKADMVPMEPVNGTAPDLIWTLQPAGTRFSVPVQVTLPNTQGLAPGRVTEFYQYDHDLEQFVSAGTMHVSADGSVLTSDPGFGLSKAGWGHDEPEPANANCTVSCDDHNECTGDGSYNCGCTHKNLTGTACGGKKTTSTCREPGTCKNGVCLGPISPDGTQCDDGVFCTEPDICTSGVCAGTPILPYPGLGGLSPVALKFEHAFDSGLDPLKVFINTYGFLGKIEPKFSADLTEMRSCCEDKKIKDSTQDQTTITAGLGVTFGPIPIPSLSINVPYVGFVGVYFTVGVTIYGKVAWNTDTCKDTDCVTGTAGIDANVEVGLGGGVAGFTLTGGANAGITANVVIGCHAVISTFGIQDTKLVVTATSKSSGHTYSAEKVIFSGQALGQTNTHLSAF